MRACPKRSKQNSAKKCVKEAAGDGEAIEEGAAYVLGVKSRYAGAKVEEQVKKIRIIRLRIEKHTSMAPSQCESDADRVNV